MGLGAVAICWTLLAAPEALEVEAALERVLAAGDYQTDLPGAGGGEDANPPAAPVEAETSSEPRRASPPERVVEETLGLAGSLLIWTLSIVAVIALLVWGGREYMAMRRARNAVAGPPRSAPVPEAAAPPPLPDHEVLAGAGRFEEAIHALLLYVISGMGRGHEPVKPALTSRELLAFAPVNEGARGALASLVRLVEVTRFGGSVATAAEYREALGWMAGLQVREAR